MKHNEAYPSKFLASADLIVNGQVKKIAVTFEAIVPEKITGNDGGTETKPVARFVGKDKRMVINKTNWGRIAELLGSDDSDDWVGKAVVLSVVKVTMKGKLVNGLSVIGRPKPGSVPPPPPPPPPLHEEEVDVDTESFQADDDDVPF